MQNKPNFRKAKMNATSILTRDYKNIANWKLGENKAHTKPIQCQNKPNQTQYLTALRSKEKGKKEM